MTPQKLIVTPGQPPVYADLTLEEIAEQASRWQAAKERRSVEEDRRMQRSIDIRAITEAANGGTVTSSVIAAIARLLGIPL